MKEQDSFGSTNQGAGPPGYPTSAQGTRARSNQCQPVHKAKNIQKAKRPRIATYNAMETHHPTPSKHIYTAERVSYQPEERRGHQGKLPRSSTNNKIPGNTQQPRTPDNASPPRDNIKCVMVGRVAYPQGERLGHQGSLPHSDTKHVRAEG